MFRGKISVILHVNDLKTSAEFYEYVLGFVFEGYMDESGELVAEWDDVVNSHSAELRAGETQVTLQESADGTADGSSVEHTLEVINIDTYYRLVSERGGAPTELLTQPWGRKEFWVADPDGHSWTFYKTLPSAAFGS